MMRILATFALLLCIAMPVPATVYLLQPDGSGDFPTIQEAIDTSVDGDTIKLADGTYRDIAPLGIIYWGKAITICSESGKAEACIIDGEGGYVVNISQGEGRDSVLDGISLVGGGGQLGGAIHIRASSPTIRNCIVRDNHSGMGGVSTSSESVLIVDCLIEHNVAGNSSQGGGGGGCLSGGGMLVNSIIRYNAAGEVGGGISIEGNPTVIGCSVYGNAANEGGGGVACYSSESLTIQVLGCSIVDNYAPSCSGVFLRRWFAGIPPGPLIFENTIIAFNTGGPAITCDDLSWPIELYCSDIFGNEGGDWEGPIEVQLPLGGNMSADPLFCDLSGGDLTLYSTSPCLPEFNECGELIGAYGQGCTATLIWDEAILPVSLHQNHPNPFNPSTEISFTLARSMDVELRIFDVGGRELLTLLPSQTLPAGRHSLLWDGSDGAGQSLASGHYFYCLRAGEHLLTGKMTLIK